MKQKPTIEQYEFGEVVIDGRTYTSDVIVFPDRVRANWWRKEGHRLDVEDLEEVIEYKPELLIVGTGYSGCMQVPEETVRYLRMKGIEVRAAPTREAVQLFNRVKDKKVVGCFHLTC